MPGDPLFDVIVSTDALLEGASGAAWVQALLDAEAALAQAEADVGLFPQAVADTIRDECRAERFEVATLGRAGRDGGNPVIPLVRQLRHRLPGEAARWVHWGATSQDMVDTAMMLVASRLLSEVTRSLDHLADAAAGLADRYRATLMVARTLLQPAVPMTFGLKAAGWLVGVLDAQTAVALAGHELPAQLGGAAGTLASLGPAGPKVLAAFAARTGLAEPTLSWATARQRVAGLATSLAIAAGTAAKIADDVALLMMPEVGELSEPAAAGRGGSSTMPHKRNPVGAASVDAAFRRAQGLASVLIGSLVSEQERAVGAWQAEWPTLTEVLVLSGGAVARVADTLAGLEVHTDAMTRNVERAGVALVTERVALALTPAIGRDAATAAVADAAAGGAGIGGFRSALLADGDVAAALATAGADLDELLRPEGYLGSTDLFVDRALARHRATRHRGTRHGATRLVGGER